MLFDASVKNLKRLRSEDEKWIKKGNQPMKKAMTVQYVTWAEYIFQQIKLIIYVKNADMQKILDKSI